MRLAFVTTELDPVVPGGIGTVVAQLATRLRERGDDITIVLVTGDDVDAGDGVVVTAATDGPSPPLERSRAAGRTLAESHALEPYDAVEFQDFDGLAFWALTRRDELGLGAVPIVLRYHLPADHILDAIGVEVPNLAVARALERESLAAADGVVVQAPSFAFHVADRYGVEPERIRIGPPPVPVVAKATGERDEKEKRLIVIGRLGEQKGSHDLVQGLAPLLRSRDDVVLEFVGGDGWSATVGRSMREWLPTLVSADVAARIRFTERLPREELAAHLAGAWMVIVPSRLESFCLAAHEARRMGFAVVARSQPAIDDYLDPAHGVVGYEDDDELIAVVSDLLSNARELDRLAAAPLPEVGDPLAVYATLPGPRDAVDQETLAAAARHHLEETLDTTSTPPGPRGDRGRGVPMVVKKVLRPLIPNRVMARYRLSQHSRHSRTNVDLMLPEGSSAKRWLSVTPDTYRAVPTTAGAVEDFALLGDPMHRDALAHALAGGADVAVAGWLNAPKLAGRRRAEPPVEPVSIAARVDVIDEVDGDGTLLAVMSRLRDAGRSFALVPQITTGTLDTNRPDRIEGDRAIVFAAVPMHDVGGGSRSAQLTLELLRGGCHVTYVAMYGTMEGIDLGMRFIHPRLEQYQLSSFDAAQSAPRGNGGFAIVEVPAAAVIDMAMELKAAGWKLLYDLIDDWTDDELGAEWFIPGREADLVAAADATTASAPDLVARLEAMGATPVLVPNAVNEAIFTGEATALPYDFPPGDGPVIGYHGSLYGGWIDRDAFAEVADAYPEARVVVVGDHHGVDLAERTNLHYLGLKPITALPGYVERFDVGLLPFRVSDVTHAVSPLKVYEYLACGVPVAAPALRSLAGLDGVHTAETIVDAVSVALEGPAPDGASARLEHGWGSRVEAMLEAVGVTRHAGRSSPAKIVLRPAAHYPKNERNLFLLPQP